MSIRIKMRPVKSKIFWPIFLATIFSFNSALAAPTCQSVLLENALQSERLDRVIYPKGVNPKKNSKGFMQIGYESEYLFSESAAILRDYAPDASVMSKIQWKELGDQQRVDWLQSQFKDRPEFATNTGLKKNVDLDFMPEELIIDSTGNVEIVLAPFDTYPRWEHAVDTIVERYGVGSQQAMISKPREAAFQKNNPKESERLYDEHLGWLVYSNVKDTFVKLSSGYERYQLDPTKLTALSFDHPFLGPMSKVKRDVMEEFLKDNAEGKKYDEDSKKFVRKSDASFKYTGGPSYRPDVAGPFRFSWEIRSSHKDVKDLKTKVKRDFVAHARGLKAYEVFADVPAFDSVAVFNSLPQGVRDSLMKIFPSKADPRFQYTANEQLVLQMYRNFSLPMMDMKPLAKALEASPQQRIELENKIEKAQAAYLLGLTQVTQNFAADKITLGAAKAQVMGLLGEFAKNSGITEAFERLSVRIGHEGKDLNEDFYIPPQTLNETINPANQDLAA